MKTCYSVLMACAVLAMAASHGKVSGQTLNSYTYLLERPSCPYGRLAVSCSGSHRSASTWQKLTCRKEKKFWSADRIATCEANGRWNQGGEQTSCPNLCPAGFSCRRSEVLKAIDGTFLPNSQGNSGIPQACSAGHYCSTRTFEYGRNPTGSKATRFAHSPSNPW